MAVYAFGEAGHPLRNPGPLIRVPQGTEVRAALHNSLEVPITVHGLENPGANGAGVRVAPGRVEQIAFKASTPGLYVYWGASEVEDLKSRFGVDAQLTGALVVDPPGQRASDEIFVIEMLSEHAGLNARQTLATINGKSWPYTKRFTYAVGEPVHWRWVNATNESHALHLHGFYYRVDAFNHGGRIQTYGDESRPLVVTQRIGQGETFDMSWSPTRAGKWLFHCHMIQHMGSPIVPRVPGLAITPPPPRRNEHTHERHEASRMGQLVLGITVSEHKDGAAIASWHAERKLQLEISDCAGAPKYALRLHEEHVAESTNNAADLIGPTIVLTRDQPVEIEVVNRLKEPTAIHWHGIELESYYDGVPGWSGAASQITPPIAPGASFVAKMTPPRAGTFIYHTHWHDASQLTNGLYGPLIVLPAGEKLDPTSDLAFVFSIGDFGALKELALINGTPQSKTLRLQVGKTYRFRFINISTNNVGMEVSLRNASGPVQWSNFAKDGAEIPKEFVRPSKALYTITVGETYDVEFSTGQAQDLVLDLLLPAQKIHTSQTLSFTPAS